MTAWIWFVLGIVVLCVELFASTFVTLWFGVSALCVALLTWLVPTMNLITQSIIWMTLSVLCCLVWFYLIAPRLIISDNKKQRQQHDTSLIGQVGLILSLPQAPEYGKIRFSMPIFGQDEWLCRTDAFALATDSALQLGERAIVTGIDGDVLVVSAYAGYGK